MLPGEAAGKKEEGREELCGASLLRAQQKKKGVWPPSSGAGKNKRGESALLNHRTKKKKGERGDVCRRPSAVTAPEKKGKPSAHKKRGKRRFLLPRVP